MSIFALFWFILAPSWPQDGPKMAQDGPKMAPRWPEIAHDAAQIRSQIDITLKMLKKQKTFKNQWKSKDFLGVEAPFWNEIGPS